MQISFLQILMLLGAFQGFIFSGFAFFSNKFKSRSNLFLGLLILTFSYNILQNFLIISGILNQFNYFETFHIPLSSVFLVLFYLYVLYFLHPNLKNRKSHFLLFVPFLIALLESILEKIGFATKLFDQRDIIYFNYFRIGFEIFNVIFSLILILASFRLIQNYERNRIVKSNKHPKMVVRWLKTISFILLVLCLYWPIPLYFEINHDLETSELYFYPLWLGLAVTIYTLGHIGLYQYGVVQEQKSIRNYSNNQTIAIHVEVENSKNENVEAFENYIKIEKNYQNPDLSLELVADELGINKSYLSRIINNEIGKSFTDYVNEMRVEEAKIYLANPDFKNYTLLAIGLEAGFNSKSVFNAAFKKFTGMTPSEYRNSIK
ncbi:helix-turn-helix domain-containing protein [Moheibacter lacus]|uniref:Helix-turn-helix transcriptional regulator n=1 Tax=Moheibacter lacus TaxID=2745851 RepID=A0A838ZUB4_9FLAO|nr:AraC family transcriptional regulator [Moheibacter lacus]MBA5630580.1 helix-turn-helix transcriptional regulator [Moheibacter lacus]